MTVWLTSLWYRFLDLFNTSNRCKQRWLVDRKNPAYVYAAFYWDDTFAARRQVKKFLGHAHYRIRDQSLIIVGDGSIQVGFGQYVWRDSDGFDTQPIRAVAEQYKIYRADPSVKTAAAKSGRAG